MDQIGTVVSNGWGNPSPLSFRHHDGGRFLRKYVCCNTLSLIYMYYPHTHILLTYSNVQSMQTGVWSEAELMWSTNFLLCIFGAQLVWSFLFIFGTGMCKYHDAVSFTVGKHHNNTIRLLHSSFHNRPFLLAVVGFQLRQVLLYSLFSFSLFPFLSLFLSSLPFF
jgi:hypothetical protein